MSNNIDKIVYINLDKRTDRKKEIETELNNFNLSYERYPAIYNSYGAVGCSQSHLNILKMAKEKGYKNILILEDDFTFLVSKEEFESNLKSFFENEKFRDYNICMLSYNLFEKEDINDANVGRVLNSQTTSSYIINSNYYDKLIDVFEKSIPLLEQTKESSKYACDMAWKPLQKKDKWYYFKTRIGKQRPSYSDIEKRHTDYKC